MTALDRLADALVWLVFTADRKHVSWGRLTSDRPGVSS